MFKDFDTALREAKKQGPRFRLFGVDYELPASIPVGAVLEAQRLQMADKDSDANVVLLLDKMYSTARPVELPAGWSNYPGHTDIKGVYHPSALVQNWIDAGLTLDGMVELTKWAFEAYGVSSKAEEGDTTDPTPAPKRGKARA